MSGINFKDLYQSFENIYCVFDTKNFSQDFLKNLCQEASDFLQDQPGFLFLTSGSTSQPKFVLHSFASLSSSALACREHLQLKPNDRWLNVISPFHMGGFSTYFRSRFLQLKPVISRSWNIQNFIKDIQSNQASLVSLVPRQVYEIRKANLLAPESLRLALIGGGALNPQLKSEIKNLGWKVLSSFGATETGSQIFTDDPKTGQNLVCLPHYEVKTDSKNHLKIKGEGLFKAYIQQTKSNFKITPTILDEQGYWQSEDKVLLNKSSLKEFLGRKTDEIKVMGYLVNLNHLRQNFALFCKYQNQEDYFLHVLPDLKSENQLVLFKTSWNDEIDQTVKDWNAQVPNHERICAQYYLQKFPRSALDKIKIQELTKKITG